MLEVLVLIFGLLDWHGWRDLQIDWQRALHQESEGSLIRPAELTAS